MLPLNIWWSFSERLASTNLCLYLDFAATRPEVHFTNIVSSMNCFDINYALERLLLEQLPHFQQLVRGRIIEWIIALQRKGWSSIKDGLLDWYSLSGVLAWASHWSAVRPGEKYSWGPAEHYTTHLAEVPRATYLLTYIYCQKPNSYSIVPSSPVQSSTPAVR